MNQKINTNNTRCSQAITHPSSTDCARRSLTLVIEREPDLT